MFELVPRPEFAEWFEGLSASVAEEVTGALEVVAAAGEALEPPGVSRALLWFDGTRAARGLDEGSLEWALRHSSEGLRAVLAWQRELLSCLDAPAFRARLGRLSEPTAERALVTVERLREDLKRWQRELMLRFGLGAVSVARCAERRAALMREFSGLLELVGLSPGHFITLANGLRELELARVSPHMRVLFGVDAANRRLVVLLGETLERVYYGDSVRRAEASWAAYQRELFVQASP